MMTADNVRSTVQFGVECLYFSHYGNFKNANNRLRGWNDLSFLQTIDGKLVNHHLHCYQRVLNWIPIL